MKNNFFKIAAVYVLIHLSPIESIAQAGLMENNIPVKVLEPVYTMKPKSSIGTIDWITYTYDDRGKNFLGDSSRYKPVVCEVINGDQSYLTSDHCNEDQDISEFEYYKKVNICIQPCLKEIRFNVRKNKDKWLEGKTSAVMNWVFTRNNEKKDTICSISVSTQLSETYYSFRTIMDSVFGESAKKLFAIDSLHLYLAKINAAQDLLNLSVKDTLRIRKQDAPKLKSENDYREKLFPAAATVKNEDRVTSGVIISGNGYLITEYSALKDSTPIFVRLSIGITISAQVIRINRSEDLALLKLDGGDFTTFSIANSDSAAAGDSVLIISADADSETGRMMTKGMIKKVNPGANACFELDRVITSGSNCSPVLNAKGQLLAIFKQDANAKFCNAIPIRRVLQQLGLEISK